MWNLMETCPVKTSPYGRPVFLRTKKRQRIILAFIKDGFFYGEDGEHIISALTFYDGWLPCLSWQTGPAPRTGEWIQVTWGGSSRIRLRWSEKAQDWVDDLGNYHKEDWHAWMHDFPDFVPPPKPAESPNELAGKSVDEVVDDIKRLADHLAIVLKSE